MKGRRRDEHDRPRLWFEGRAEEAAGFYVSLFPESRIDRVVRAPADAPGGADGAVLVVEFTLDGRRFIALNGGARPFTEAVSFAITCRGQDEVDRLWDALCEGGAPGRCGWLADRFGLHWQVVPEALPRLLGDPDRERAGRVMRAMMGMGKLDVAALERAAETGQAA